MVLMHSQDQKSINQNLVKYIKGVDSYSVDLAYCGVSS